MILVMCMPVSGLEIEQCRFLVPDESGPRFVWHTRQKPAPEKWNWRRFLERVSWILLGFVIVVYVTMCVVACSWAWQGRSEVHRLSRWIFLHSQRPARLYN